MSLNYHYIPTHVCVSGLSRAVVNNATCESRTRHLLIAVQCSDHCAIEPHSGLDS